MNKFFKTFLGIIIIFVPLALVLLLVFNGMAKKSFYSVSGETSVSGLGANVKIYFDDYGVPHIFAENEKDMYFAMGYMHAQDRLWQMDLTRRVAEGKLAEILGGNVLEFDKLFRTIGIDKFSYKWYESLNPKSKEILTEYTAGINMFMETHQNNLPVEFDALNYKPEPWKPEHSLMIGRLMGWDLNIAWYTDYIFGEIVNKVGIEKAGEIFPDSTFSLYKKPDSTSQKDSTKESRELGTKNQMPVLQMQQTASLGKGFFDSYQNYRAFFNINCSHTGSNAWVVSGEKSMTGKPILANDPHLGFQAPSKWYELHMKSNLTDVRGMTIAGVPGVIIGNNRNISWGMTNLMNDDNDFFVMQKDSADNNKYIYKNQKYSLDSIVEKIKVKDSIDADFTIKLTKIGPVVSRLNQRGFAAFGSVENQSIYKDKLLTFRWTGFEQSDEIGTFYKINNAKNWDEFTAGLKDFCVPATNFVYADINGNIGYHVGGKIPIRKTNNNTSYIFPQSGETTKDELDWEGFIDFDKLPNSYNPKEGYIVTANTNPFDVLKTEAKNRYYIAYLWEPSSRFDKIKSFLDGKSKLDLDEFQLMQMNYESLYAKEIAKYILEAFKDYSVNDNDIKWCLERFKNWDGEMKPANPIGSVYNAFFTFLIKNTYADQLGEKVFYDFLIIQNMPYRATMNLLRSNNSTWFDNVNTIAVEKKNDIIRKSLQDAIIFLKTKFSNPDINTWNWGDIHKVKFRHPLGIVPALDKTFNIGPFDVGGDQTTINNSEYSFNDVIKNGEFLNTLGPSMRIIVNMADPVHPLSVNTTGQSGQPLHPNYQDQARLWQFGEYKNNTMSELEMMSKEYKRLTLIPKN
jgi:penicillin amidase